MFSGIKTTACSQEWKQQHVLRNENNSKFSGIKTTARSLHLFQAPEKLFFIWIWGGQRLYQQHTHASGWGTSERHSLGKLHGRRPFLYKARVELQLEHLHGGDLQHHTHTQLHWPFVKQAVRPAPLKQVIRLSPTHNLKQAWPLAF